MRCDTLSLITSCVYCLAWSNKMYFYYYLCFQFEARWLKEIVTETTSFFYIPPQHFIIKKNTFALLHMILFWGSAAHLEYASRCTLIAVGCGSAMAARSSMYAPMFHNPVESPLEVRILDLWILEFLNSFRNYPYCVVYHQLPCNLLYTMHHLIHKNFLLSKKK